MAYGLLIHGPSGNLGDAVQSLAARRFLPRVDRLVERERLGDIAAAGPVKVIMNGWWMKCPEHWPPPPNVIPLFVSFHVTTGAARAAIGSAESLAYLRRHEPIGCRDLDTMHFLRSAGVDAYFSGCLTMTLPPRPRGAARAPLFVDPCRGHFFGALPGALAGREDVGRLRRAAGAGRADEAASLLAAIAGLPEAWRVDARWCSAQVGRETSPVEKLRAASALLDRLAAARFVVTSRLHAALPALAMGTPCLLVLKDDSATSDGHGMADLGHDCTRHDPRFPGLLEQIPHVPFSRLLQGVSGEAWHAAARERLRLREDLVAALESRIAAFLRDDSSGPARSAVSAAQPAAATPVRWLSSPLAARRGLGRWRGVYPSVANVRAPHACHGSIPLDLRDLLDPVMPEAGVLELDRPFLQGIGGQVFAADGTLLPDHSWYGRHVDELGWAAPMGNGEPVPGVSISLASDFGHKNFCHFVLDGLCRLHLFEAAGIRLETVDRVYCQAPPTEEARRLLDRLGIPAGKLEWLRRSSVVRPETLHVATLPGSRRNYPRWLPGFVQERWPVMPSRSDRRLFVSRKGYRRSAHNEAAVRRLLQAAGFEIHDPARSADSRQDFAEAAIIVGAHGTGLANIAWCRPGTKVLELLPSDHVYPYYYTLSESAGLEYGCLVCRSVTERPPGTRGPSLSDFHVDLEELAAAVATLTAG